MKKGSSDLNEALGVGVEHKARGGIEQAGQLEEASIIMDDVHEMDHEGKTPLHRAAMYGDQKEANSLIERGANLEVQDFEGSTPLHWAARYGQQEMVRFMIEREAKANAVNARGETPLHYAVIDNKNAAVVADLISYGVNIEAVDFERKTPLHMAAIYGHQEVANILIDNHADLEAQDYEGKTPLYLAVSLHNLDMIPFLVAKGANVNASLNQSGETILHHYAITKHADRDDGIVKALEILIENGANVDAVTNDRSRTPLHFAAIYHETDKAADLLISKGADIDAKDIEGKTPLHFAAYYGNKPVLYKLLEEGADVNKVDNEGRTALESARYALNVTRDEDKYQGIVSELASYEERKALLHAAVLRGDLGSVRSLLESSRVGVNAQDVEGRTPLHLAALRGYTNIADLLMSKGANINARDVEGMTPLHLASCYGNRGVFDCLIAKKADVNLLDNKGKKVLDYLNEALIGLESGDHNNGKYISMISGLTGVVDRGGEGWRDRVSGSSSGVGKGR